MIAAERNDSSIFSVRMTGYFNYILEKQKSRHSISVTGLSNLFNLITILHKTSSDA